MRKFNVNVNGKAYAVEVEEMLDDSVVISNPVKVAAAAPKAAAPAPAGNGTPVKAPMTGLVKKLCFANGASVKKGDTIIILEAMKMDTPVSATGDGVITYSTSEGTNVDTGAVLATIA
ncbi:MAG: acetyl-CoA carboxylase biotin carboxyl carrier protein subunit [Clostridia bacterium]|nr:acetyl-CoA carboxylase biotin carboxyl carrier protein subunit [Clostridia bacterium]MDE7328735.1 acetyl-CoA carboxylase biotin carboxyl carrier protein subunit [Clostridia bacterium]